MELRDELRIARQSDQDGEDYIVCPREARPNDCNVEQGAQTGNKNI
jgi:hypothetical protein